MMTLILSRQRFNGASRPGIILEFDDEIVEAIEYVRNAKEKLTRETVRDIVLGISQWETIGDFNASDG